MSATVLSVPHRVLAWTYHPLRLAKAAARPLGLSSPHRLRVLIYHDVAPEERAAMATQLRWLARRWTFVSPGRFAALATGAEPVRGSNLLLTFDDGFASNRRVAEDVLKPLGIEALFFVVSDFVAFDDAEASREFIARNILPMADASALPAHMRNMTWADVEALLEAGHVVGAHTRTHARLSQEVTPETCAGEIAAGADALERRLGVKIDHFAYTYGDIASIGAAAVAAARRRFRFVYSGLRGDNARGVSPLALRRDAVRAAYPVALLGALLEGAADFQYASARAQLDSWSSADREAVR